MSDPENILAKINSEGLHVAMRDFPPAAYSKEQTLDGETVTVNGRRVIVTFQRLVYKHYKNSYCIWRLQSARYIDE